MIDSGILLIDKPTGISSFDVIRKLRKITGIRKMGHTGTLDPFASGLLIICLGKTTRISNRIIAEKKEYLATMELGRKTDTGDLTGKLIEERTTKKFPTINFEQLTQEILQIKEQIPHRFSALKINGKKAYELARKEADFQLKPRPVEILDFSFEKVDLPEITYKTTVSKGTYIRVLSETIAEMLNTVGVTVTLRRTAIGELKIDKAYRLDELDESNWQDKLFPMINLFTEYPQIEISESEKEDYKQGRRFRVTKSDSPDTIVTCAGIMLGFAEIDQFILKPRTVMI